MFLTYNIVGGIVWGAGVTLLGYLLGQIAFIRDNIDIIFLLIVFVSVVPIILEVGKHLIAKRRAAAVVEAEATAVEAEATADTVPVPTTRRDTTP